jgi:hypothetical protein
MLGLCPQFYRLLGDHRTGSADGTQKFMKAVPGELHELSWVNFAHNRNQALSLAKEKA